MLCGNNLDNGGNKAHTTEAVGAEAVPLVDGTVHSEHVAIPADEGTETLGEVTIDRRIGISIGRIILGEDGSQLGLELGLRGVGDGLQEAVAGRNLVDGIRMFLDHVLDFLRNLIEEEEVLDEGVGLNVGCIRCRDESNHDGK